MSQIPVFFLLSLPLIGAYAMFAIGVVVIHRSSRVLNLAHGAMAMAPAYLSYELTERGAPAPVALVAAMAAGALIGVTVERLFVRTLRPQGATAQTVGTVAALGLIVGIAVKVWGTTPKIATGVFPEGGVEVGASILRWGQLGLFGIAIVAAAALFAFFRLTDTGLAMRGVADNRRAAALMGVDPDRMTVLAWALGGVLAGLGGTLLAAVTVLHPINLTLLMLPAFVAALIGGLESLPGSVIGAAVVGLVQGMVPALGLIPGIGDFATQVGATQVALAVLAFVVMVMRGERFTGSDSRATPEPARAATGDAVERPPLLSARTARRVRTAGGSAVMALLVALPFLGASFSLLGDAIQAGIYTLIAASLVLLTGWVGQISLAQAAFVGIGAFVAAKAANGLGLDFPLNLPVAVLVAGAVATLLGLVALRVRGLYLAVATLIFLWMANEYLFRTSWLVGAGGSARIDGAPIGRPEAFPYFDFGERRTFYLVVLAVVAATLRGLANLRRSKTGRAFFAVRGSETAAASLGIDVTRTKLLAFAISGALAGVAGVLQLTGQNAVSAAQFGFVTSLFYLSIPVVGGLRSLGGAVAASALFAGLTELFFNVEALAGWLEIVSAGLLAAVLLLYPQGLAGIGARAHPWLRRLGLVRAPTLPRARVSLAETPDVVDVRAREERPAVLEVSGLTVRFGGLTAVEDVSLQVREGEIVGLIGPNGAGKTTTFNAISGLNQPSAGTVALFCRDVTAMPVHERAALGVARTFQVIQLFGDLTVFDNLLVATHLSDPTGAASHVAVTRAALQHEAAARQRVADVIAQLGLSDIAMRPVSGLPFGTLRMVELARAAVTGAKLVMLDEPASGLDSAETERMSEHLLRMRATLGLSILLIEHDVKMVTSVSDYMYVIDRGRPLADGIPSAVQRDERVVAAYLGTAPAERETVAEYA